MTAGMKQQRVADLVGISHTYYQKSEQETFIFVTRWRIFLVSINGMEKQKHHIICLILRNTYHENITGRLVLLLGKEKREGFG